ncbi:MAG TPA: radical SAM protein [Anaerolineales bacterium]
MDGLQRLIQLSSQMDLEPAEEAGRLGGLPAGCPGIDPPPGRPARKDVPDISQAVLPGGRTIPLLKTLLTSACERNCYYCPFRAGRDFRRETFKPAEMADTFMGMQRAGLVQGLFLSSGVAGGGLRTQDQLIATAEILRYKYQYRGYLHLKLMPGAEKAQVERAMQLSDRVSVNLEAPNTRRLELLAPRKDFLEELLQPLRWVEEIRRTQSPRRSWNGRWPSMTTQFVVGAVGESDLELLQTTAQLTQQLHLSRAYFSAFRPIADTPLENLPPESPQRQARLYQASFLLRDYGFQLEDLPFDASTNLPLDTDPKTAWARSNLAGQPVEINRANRQELLRVPGIGPLGADKILSARRQGRLRQPEDLRKIGVNPARLLPYILMDGRAPARQLRLF